MTDSSITVDVFKGKAVSPYLEDLAKLRILFYRNYPYLYEGTLTNEQEYLSMYANSENCLMAVARRGQEIVGAAAGIALLETHEMHKKLWVEREIPAQNVFYLGEIVLLQEYQNSDVQERLYQQIEQGIREFEKYDSIVVCEIERASEDSKKTVNFLSSEVLWDTRGFTRQEALSTYFSWKDVDDSQESDHLMVFWNKAL